MFGKIFTLKIQFHGFFFKYFKIIGDDDSDSDSNEDFSIASTTNTTTATNVVAALIENFELNEGLFTFNLHI